MKPAVFKMLQDHLHGNRLPKHPAVCRHPKGGVPAGGHRAHVSLPPHLHHHSVYGGPSLGAVLQMLPNIQVVIRGERSQLPMCFCAVRSGGTHGSSYPTADFLHKPVKVVHSARHKHMQEFGHKNRMWWNIQNRITPRRNVSYWKHDDSLRPSVLLQSLTTTKLLINV